MEPDTSYVAVGAVLLQNYNDSLHSVAFSRKKYIPAEDNYAPHNKELLAIYKACQTYRCHLGRHQTTVFIDYKPLVILQI